MDDVQVSNEMVGWLKERIELCGNAAMSDFAATFKYSHREDADRAFSVLISKSFLRKSIRHTLQSNYEVWKRNEGEQFWASLEATTRVATDLVVGSVPKARKIVLGDNHQTRAKPNTQAAPVARSDGIPDEYASSTPERTAKGNYWLTNSALKWDKHQLLLNMSLIQPHIPRIQSHLPLLIALLQP